MEQLVYEEYDTEEHKVLAIVLENEYVNVIRECPSSWVSGRWSITGPDSIPKLLLTSHKPGGHGAAGVRGVWHGGAQGPGHRPGEWGRQCDKAVVRNIGIKHS